MILVVCLNPALDITHEVAVVDWAGINRPAAVHDRPGGKGLNVARTLHALGADVLVTGMVGGITGTGVAAALSTCGVRTAFTPVDGPTRRTFTVVDGSAGDERGDVASFYEPGPVVGAAEFAGFLDDYREALAGADAVVLSGSLPLGLPDSSYATLTEVASGLPVILDAHGEALRLGVTAGPAIVKPNLAELTALSPRQPTMAAAARELLDSGAQAVVVTLGHDGLLAVTGEGCWRARSPAAVAGNATGAGDAVAAALAHGLVLGRPWDERLRHAVALGAATAAAPVAGEFRSCDYTGALAAVTVDQVSAEEVG
ncbi:MAG TPA: hexose kinase [Streptosporangiaceae bacterium]|nr:hexose kinase [Streptosporangiaceae bacterium]